MISHAEWRWKRKENKPDGTQAIIRWASTNAPLGFHPSDVPEHLLGSLEYPQIRHNLLKMRTIKFIELDDGRLKQIRILAEGIGRTESQMFSSSREAEAAGFSRRLVNEALAGTHRRGKVYAGYRWHHVHKPMKRNIEMKHAPTINKLKAYLHDMAAAEGEAFRNPISNMNETGVMIGKIVDIGLPPKLTSAAACVVFSDDKLSRRFSHKLKKMLDHAKNSFHEDVLVLVQPTPEWYCHQAKAHLSMLRSYCELMIRTLEEDKE